MADKKPSYQDWKSRPDLTGETPDSNEGHRIIVSLWIVGMILFSGAVWGLAYLTSFLQPGSHANTLLGGH